MPQNNVEVIRCKQAFFQIASFPNVIGTIDCTHVRIQSPGGNLAEHFRNRKGYFSLNIQTVVDATSKISNIVARWPGATHDSTIFNNSRLKAVFDGNTYRGCMLLGDSGYALNNYLMTPLLNPITPEEMLYNESHIRTRNVVERSYGIWKRRFPILKLEMRVKLQTAQTIIVATGVLHNIALQMADDLPEDNEEYINEIEVDNAAVPIANNNGNVRENLIRDYFSTLL